MPRSLPPRPNLRHLKIQARELQKAYSTGDPDAVARVRLYHPRHRTDQTVDASLSLADAQLAIAREYGASSWPDLKVRVERHRPTALYSGDLSFYSVYVERLREEAQAGFEPAIERMRAHVSRFANASADDVRLAVTHDDARRVYAGEHGYETWDAFGDAVDAAGGEVEDPFVVFVHAVEDGDLEKVRGLLDSHPGLVHECASTDKTPLHSAMHPEVTALLIERGAPLDVEAPLPGGTPLMHHLVWGSPATAEIIAAHSLAPGNLRVAAGLGRMDLLRELLPEHGKPTEAACSKRDYYRPNYGWYAWTPGDSVQEVLDEALIYAATNNRTEASDYLVEHGADVNGLAYETRPIIRAAWKGWTEMVAWLLNHGADIRATGWLGGHAQGVTALHMAANSGHLETARLLVDHGADLELRDPLYNGKPAGWAEHHGHKQVAEFLRDAAERGATK